jgi:hypothetical protein
MNASNENEGRDRIGDCVAPNFISEAIFDGHRLAREIDSDDPAHPLPFIRERASVSAVTVSYQ